MSEKIKEATQEDQEKQEEIEKVAFSRDVSFERVSDVAIDDIDFMDDLDVLNDAFQRKEHIQKFVLPDGKEFHFVIRGLTSAERNTIKKNVYGKASLAMLREFGNSLSDAEFTVKLQETVTSEEEIEGRTNEMYETLLKGITRPVGLTREHLEGWDNMFINALYDAIEELSVTPDNFRGSDSTSGE